MAGIREMLKDGGVFFSSGEYAPDMRYLPLDAKKGFRIEKIPYELLEYSKPAVLLLKEDSASSPVKNPGGIDLNPGYLDLQTQGQEIEFDIPFDAQTIMNAPIDGFAPVIIQIVPANIPMLLGKSEREQEAELSYVY
jgi:hypothetical protein